ncbi:MAG: ATP-binding protein, partial [Bacteroides sp.]|nr:ATP-binding protein [Bacteroides sp.]
MKRVLFLLTLLPLLAVAQTYRYIGVEEGLSNRRIFDIKKDSTGYMWFLTNEGVDRYNGKEIKHYKVVSDNVASTSPVYLGWLIADQGTIWTVGRKGRIFRYDELQDRFMPVFLPAEPSTSISYAAMDWDERIWLCTSDSILLFHACGDSIMRLANVLGSDITHIAQTDKTHFFIATEEGVQYIRLEGEKRLTVVAETPLSKIQARVSQIYYHHPMQTLLIGTFGKGVYTYDLATNHLNEVRTRLRDANITRIMPLNTSEVLIATEGMGVHKMNMETRIAEPYIQSSYQGYNEISSNNVSQLYIDDAQRIWLANYPTGITVIDYRYKHYDWLKHADGNAQSLVNSQVHAVIEDSDGDLWFGTSNGISLYQSKTGRWHSFLSSFDPNQQDKNHIFITLCEVSPGIIWAGGYTSGLYKINKHTLSVDYFFPYRMSAENIQPDRYIRGILKDAQGMVWSGGYYNLKRIDPAGNHVHLYPGLGNITALQENDEHHLWVGTSNALYRLNKDTGEYTEINLHIEASYINSLYQSESGLLYVGTNDAGLVVYDTNKQTTEHYYSDNCALVSNNIYTILPESDGRILMSTDNGITCFTIATRTFQNLTKEQGLLASGFNANSGVLCRNKEFIFGSTDGAIVFPADTRFLEYTYSPMILSDLQLFYQVTYPGDAHSPLNRELNDTERLKLKYSQNTFSLKVSSINYDAPSNILYSWKLEGFYDDWSLPGTDNQIRYTNIAPGKYTLCIRAISKAEPYLCFEERHLDIVIDQPFWLSIWAILLYVALVVCVAVGILRIILLKRQQKASDEKTQFFINTAHDIRTPLTLIKAPLEELSGIEKLSEQATNCINIALRNVNTLLQLTTNLINFERAASYSSKLHTNEYELNAYLQELCALFCDYATTRNIHFTYSGNFTHLMVQFDKEKMDSILKNILSNAFKYTPDNGSVIVTVKEEKEHWKLVVKDTGIGIPSKELKKIFRLHFRATNAINAKITGSGMGLMLVNKLVQLHGGKINIDSAEQQGTTVTLRFPKHCGTLQSGQTAGSKEADSAFSPTSFVPLPLPTTTAEKEVAAMADGEAQRLLIVEDNDELRTYLARMLSDAYQVRVCVNGREALTTVKEFWPDLVVSDIMMPEMRGDELCVTLKNDIETSHIPIVLLTALGEEKNIVEGLQTGADEYMVKPFNVNILKATIANLLANRALLRKRYAAMDDDTPPPEPDNTLSELDRKFLSTVHQSVADNTDFTVDTLCSLIGMSRTSFYNKLKALTGQAPADYVRLARLKEAARLLKEGNCSITEVAERTGFCDTKYFREVFKKHYRMSPSQYAKGD